VASTGLEDNRGLHAEHAHSDTIDFDDVDGRLESGEEEEVIVGKKRQIVGILVSIFNLSKKPSWIDSLSRFYN
jgi:hypothetical protein